ncbi:hypothetical protein LSH36_519g01009 [Paralvinella palmiformis]|uniref:Adenosine deaminase n=1 Tax=Paralvinella palmiformis TaxID=53620 RepID=A0AAD9J892_9ANNE|nr:hypothetical protein LSH36_519g01009 [Paralvinella palmiformis]
MRPITDYYQLRGDFICSGSIRIVLDRSASIWSRLARCGVFTLQEEIVDRYLQYKKYEHFLEVKDSGFPPQRPIQEVLDIIQSSDVYRLLEKLPKGGNMHTHENHQLSKKTLYDIVWASEDFQYLYILPEDHPTTPWTLDFFINPPPGQGWTKVMNHPNLTKEMIEQHQTLIGTLSAEAKKYPSDSAMRWDEMNRLWDRGSTQLISNIKIKPLYLRALYESALDEGVQYLETRKNFGAAEMLYELSSDPEYEPTYGKKFLDTNGELDINLTINVTREFIGERPEFIGHRRITYSTRFSENDAIRQDVEKAIAFRQKYPDHFKGYDLVAEEDFGHSHLYFVEELLTLYDPMTQKSKVDVFLHTAETSWPEDLMTAEAPEDLVASAENALDALLLGTKRIGHGLAYIKYPYLLNELRSRQVAVEICPVSNQILGLQADLRNHPGQHYIQMGIPVVLGADDPGSFGYDNFTVDWYEVFMGWGLGLRQLKKLAQNALDFSTMTDDQKREAYEKWTPYWDAYIANISAEACRAPLNASQPLFYRLIPKEGALVEETAVHVYGRHFERAVCRSVRCRFGAVESSVTRYVSSTHVMCTSPPGNGSEFSVAVTISLDGGLTYFDTGKAFTYKHDTSRHEPTELCVKSGATNVRLITNNINIIIVMILAVSKIFI